MKTKLLSIATTILFSATALSQDGTFDNTFNSGSSGYSHPYIYSIAAQSDDKLIFPAVRATYNGATVDKDVIRLNADGSRDNTFLYPGNDAYGIYTVKVLTNDKILVGKNYSSGGSLHTKLQLLNSDGSIVTTFDSNAYGGTIRSITESSGGKLVVSGSFTTYNTTAGNVVRLNSDGTVDNTFSETRFDIAPYGSYIDRQGRILVWGTFSKIYKNNQPIDAKYLVRLNADGSLDTSFQSNVDGKIGVAAGFAGVTVQSDGKIVIGAGYSDAGVVRNTITRLNDDGTLDTSFNPGTGITAGYGGINKIEKIHLQDDGKFIIAGTFGKYNDNIANGITRINSDGTFDSTFNTGGTGTTDSSGGSNYVNDFTQQNSTKKLVLIGGYTKYNGNNANYINRINFTQSFLSNKEIKSQSNSKITIFPNPSTGNFTVKNSEKISKLEIVDLSGKLIKILQPNSSEVNLNLENQPKGIYLIKTNSGKNSSTQKLILK